MDSILNHVKDFIGGIPAENTVFDSQLIPLINMAISTLTQLGIGPSTGYAISGQSDTWHDFFGDDPRLEMCKTYVSISCKLNFDPPSYSFVGNAYKNQLDELQWRISVVAEELRRENDV